MKIVRQGKGPNKEIEELTRQANEIREKLTGLAKAKELPEKQLMTLRNALEYLLKEIGECLENPLLFKQNKD